MSEVFRPGDRVPATGIYKVVHEYQHYPTHHVTVLCGDLFPTCLGCSERVQFEVALSAVHVNAHPQFHR